MCGSNGAYAMVCSGLLAHRAEQLAMRSAARGVALWMLSMAPTCPAMQRRSLLLRPDATVDPEAYPEGFISLTGTEPEAFVYAAVKSGHYVSPAKKLEVAHRVAMSVQNLHNTEAVALNYDDYLKSLQVKQELLSRVLLRREFWQYEDFNDPELNQSFGRQNNYFDNYAWSQEIWKEFRVYCERWMPVSEHSHIPYFEYNRLLEYFAYEKNGLSVPGVLRGDHKLHPMLGTLVPRRGMLEPYRIYIAWLETFRSPFMLNKALVLRAGWGALALATRNRVKMVRATDPSPMVVERLRNDSLQLGKNFSNMSFAVADMFPEPDPNNKNKHVYDMIVFAPEIPYMSSAFGDDAYVYSPSAVGLEGELERFFEKAGEYLRDWGIAVILFSNYYSLAYPNRPHPIEFEVKVNRRWVVLDYYDRPTKARVHINTELGMKLELLRGMAKSLRGELWVLHRVEAIPHFGWIHKIPGATPPAQVAGQWRSRELRKKREQVFRDQAQREGISFGDFRSRLLSSLQDTSQIGQEDDFTEAVRVAMDPTYASQLADRARRVIEGKMDERKAFVDRVAADYGITSSAKEAAVSPRQRFEQEFEEQYASKQPTPAASAVSTKRGASSELLERRGSSKRRRTSAALLASRSS